MKQAITPSFSRFGIPGLDFKAYGGGGPPTAYYFGFRFSETQVGNVYTGAFSPHSILKPAKDTVDVKAWIWSYLEDTGAYAATPTIGWCAMMYLLRSDLTLGQPDVAYVPPDSVDKVFADMGYRAAGGLYTGFGNLSASAVNDNDDIDWYNNDMGLGVKYPYFQVAQGFSNVNLNPSMRPILGMHRTPLYLVKKKGNTYYLDNTFCFKNFARILDTNFPCGAAIFVHRMRGNDVAAGGGAVANGVLGTDNMNGNAVFLGLEVEIV